MPEQQQQQHKRHEFFNELRTQLKTNSAVTQFHDITYTDTHTCTTALTCTYVHRPEVPYIGVSLALGFPDNGDGAVDNSANDDANTTPPVVCLHKYVIELFTPGTGKHINTYNMLTNASNTDGNNTNTDSTDNNMYTAQELARRIISDTRRFAALCAGAIDLD